MRGVTGSATTGGVGDLSLVNDCVKGAFRWAEAICFFPLPGLQRSSRPCSDQWND